MKKILQTTLLTASLIATATAFAGDGLTPTCTKGKLNIVIVNKDVDCSVPKSTSYCLFDFEFEIDSAEPFNNQCHDFSDSLDKNQTNSMSFKGSAPKKVSIAYNVTHYNNSKWDVEPKFKVVYKNKKLQANCTQIMGQDVNCTVSESTDAQHHKTYTLVLSKAR